MSPSSTRGLRRSSNGRASWLRRSCSSVLSRDRQRKRNGGYGRSTCVAYRNYRRSGYQTRANTRTGGSGRFALITRCLWGGDAGRIHGAPSGLIVVVIECSDPTPWRAKLPERGITLSLRRQNCSTNWQPLPELNRSFSESKADVLPLDQGALVEPVGLEPDICGLKDRDPDL